MQKQKPQLEKLQEMLEWNCNDTNNHHCRIVTEMLEDSHSRALKVWPRTNEKGEYEKISGFDSVLRQIFMFERDNPVIVSTVKPDSGLIIVRELEE